MNETPDDLLNLATKFLNEQKFLDARIFDKNGQMHNLLRQRLLHRAQYMALETVGKIGGLSVDDVILVGSSASYLYRPESDLDAIIKVSNTSCPYLPSSTEQEDMFQKYLSLLTAYFFNDHEKFFIGKRYLDIKLRSRAFIDFTGLYSVQNNKWLMLPEKNITRGITPEMLLNKYHTRCQEFTAFMESFTKDGEKYSQEQCDEMYAFYAKQVTDKNKNIVDYLTFKIIKADRKSVV